MDLLPTEAQKEIAAAAAEFIDGRLPVDLIRSRRAEPRAVDAATWSECAEMGLFGLGLPEELGGAGCGPEEEALVFRELGRRLAPGPFLSTVLGARVAALAGEEEIASSILTGEKAVGLAQRRADVRDGLGGGSGGGLGEGAGDDGRGEISGRFDLCDAAGADYVLVLEPAGAALVETGSLLDVATLTCIDPAVRLATARAAAAPAVARVAAGTEPVYLRGLVLAAAFLVGIAEASRDMAAEYAKLRVQFGRPIGVNQAIKHACADMAVRAEAALAQLLFAAVCVRSGRSDLEFQATAAKVVAGRAGRENSGANIQVHGGMGYTFEHDAHLYMKRARVVDLLVGSPTDHLARLLALPAAQ